MILVVAMDDGLEVLRDILPLFPGSEDAIRALLTADEEFHELCADYTECLVVLERLQQGHRGADVRIEQYRELREGLEQELLDRLSASAPEEAGCRTTAAEERLHETGETRT